ncbi:enoyl-CoA hydratase [Phenylobacterium sp. Root700]|uniref:enoyl-CoA hydratase n=1 Tax=Phenylobacterium sp. Root700 TaxID=1736591 RepID=UPI0006F32645|nr:enoyl-CoA hydratase [Phenylobacterium sp. Root700]KRB49667.1 enoyl-CoA hydratase [Phenylobacterium sp. Root700]
MTAHWVASPLVAVGRNGGRVDLCLNRPAQFNALSEELLAALKDELSIIASDPSVRCVVLSGAGTAFCTGHDLGKMRGSRGLDHYRQLFAHCADVMEAIIALPVPVIARVHGVAAAAGCQLVASCDLAVAADTARLAVSGVNVGLFCSPPTAALSRNVPTKRAFEMLLAARFIDAATAEAWGLINKATPAADLDATVDEFVAAIEAKSPAAIRWGKALLHAQPQRTNAAAHAMACDLMARNMMEEDAGEGVDAFFEKRPAVSKS